MINPPGCTDETACNYYPDAVNDDGSCEYEFDCAGECGGDATIDNCDICDSNLNNDCQQDCFGNWGGNAEVDCFGVCGGNAEFDCAGNCGGNTIIDICGECGGDGICYEYLKITSVRVNSYSYSCDFWSNCDPFIRLFIGTSYQQTNYVQDFSYSNMPLTLNFNSPQNIYDFNTNLRLYLIDDDNSYDDVMGYSGYFSPIDIHNSSNINQFTITGNNYTSFTIFVQWYE